MSERGTQDVGTTEAQEPRRRWSIVGPGIVVTATGVGAGDLVATLVAGSEYGYTLLWAVVLGVVVKVALAEATGRWHLATGSTIFAGWRSLGPWTTVYFVVYVVIWGFVYGATAMTSSVALSVCVCKPVGVIGREEEGSVVFAVLVLVDAAAAGVLLLGKILDEEEDWAEAKAGARTRGEEFETTDGEA